MLSFGFPEFGEDESRVKCPNCGAESEDVYLSGASFHCFDNPRDATDYLHLCESYEWQVDGLGRIWIYDTNYDETNTGKLCEAIKHLSNILLTMYQDYTDSWPARVDAFGDIDYGSAVEIGAWHEERRRAREYAKKMEETRSAAIGSIPKDDPKS